MLTEKEERWLEGRKVLCPRCDHYRDHVEGRSTCHRGEKGGWMQAECRFFQRKDLIPDYKDAAEFEARVGNALLGFACKHCPDFGKFPVCPYTLNNRPGLEECQQRFARLYAEEEMPI